MASLGKAFARGLLPVWLTLGSLAIGLGGCKKNGSEDTLLVVRASTPLPQSSLPTRFLRVSLQAGSATWMRDFPGRPPNEFVVFPADFSLQLPRSQSGPVRLMVEAIDRDNRTIASAGIERLEFEAGKRTDIELALTCHLACVGDGGDAGRPDAVNDAPMPPRDGLPTCGNGRLDDDEICDPGITTGWPGACPPASCDDGIACTVDRPIGSGCQLTCDHTPVTETKAGDTCCPPGANAQADSDCSATCGNGTREAGETCDTGAPAGAPSACPSEADCDDRDPCTSDELISAGTCSALCAHRPIVGSIAGDGCCPANARADRDKDCPAVCGNWEVDPGEACDRAQQSTSSGSCPQTCEPATNDACVLRTLGGAGCGVSCTSTRIVLAVPGDGCCPEQASRNTDTDCPTLCGNGVLEAGEACDNRIPAGTAGACPASCPASGVACLGSRLEGRAEDCSARCTSEPITACSSKADGCCPGGCVAGQDPDCLNTCGNGVVDSGETCDIALTAGSAGACPQSCGDGKTCTTDYLLARGTCQARCAYVEVTQFIAGDGCCPTKGGHNLLDGDCPASCGNGIVESPQETCDMARPAGTPGACPTECPSLPAGCARFALRGAPETCSSKCVLETVSTCVSNDGCCPSGCTRSSDSDCPAVCGNALVEEGETCDVGITAGKPGACAAFCDDGDSCTTDVTLGRRIDCTRRCRFDRITLCREGDGCCPQGCTRELDADCAPASCGNRKIEERETCDPATSCPTRCPEDGDPCTVELLVGEARLCTARCQSTPISTCSGATADRCCPTGCAVNTDVDCALPPVQPPRL